jgi:hypothetical protein
LGNGTQVESDATDLALLLSGPVRGGGARLLVIAAAASERENIL